MQHKKNARLAGPRSKKFKFTKNEDAKLISLVQIYGENDWRSVADQMNFRTPRQCRERWTNYVNPDLNKKPWSIHEDMCLVLKHQEFGNKWKIIQQFFPGRSKNDIKHRAKQIEMDSANPRMDRLQMSPTNTPQIPIQMDHCTKKINADKVCDEQDDQCSPFESIQNMMIPPRKLFLIGIQDLWPPHINLPVLESK